MKITLGYFYPKHLNLYGDSGNVETLMYRSKRRNIDVEVIEVGLNTDLNSQIMESIDLIFMGGGPDAQQKSIYEDLITKKGPYINDYVENNGIGLFICGAYQLMGNYYKSADGTILKGLGILDLYTQHLGNHKPRCVGNVVCEIVPELRHDIFFNANNKVGSSLVGFENHGGRTYLGEKLLPFGKVLMGYGNNAEDKTEGVLFKGIIGTYLHGPILARNPHIADYLIAKSTNMDVLRELDDELVIAAHTASKNLRQ